MLRGIALLALALASANAAAQDFRESAAGPADLIFPAEATMLDSYSPLEMAIYRPENAGPGPFPGVVLVHGCGGLRQPVRVWTGELLKQGYAVFVMDSLGPRNVKEVCDPPARVTPPRGLLDALQAMQHLKAFPFVDKARIGLVGFSWGATVGALAASPGLASTGPVRDRFAAIVSFYPACAAPATGKRPAREYLRPDSDRPLLVLMGGQDNETPPSECLHRLEALKTKGMPVEWHLYPDATHCWDCRELHNVSKTDARGERVTYRFSRDVTEDSRLRAFEFLERTLKR